MIDRPILTLKRKPEPTTVEIVETIPAAVVNPQKRIHPATKIILTRKLLIETFPLAFCEERNKPLAIGIYEQIVKALPDYSTKRLKKCLKNYCEHKNYIQSIIDETHRIDLTGQPTAEITPEEKTNAEERLVIKKAEKFKQYEEMKAAKLAAKNATENVTNDS